MKQKKIKSLPALIAAGTKASGGADEFDGIIALVYGSKANIDADVAALVSARDNYVAGQTELKTCRNTLNAVVKTAVSFILTFRDGSKQALGTQPSPTWLGTGFESKFGFDRSADGARERTRLLKTYLANHPTMEVAQFNLTAVRAESLVNDITAAQNALNAKIAAVGTLLDVREAKEKALRVRLSGLTQELGRLIDPLDQRWKAFGLNMPGAKETPPAPENVTAVLVGANAVAVNWDASARADYYRVWVKVNGVDEELMAVGSPADLDFTINGLLANTKIEIAVSAVNNGGESGKSTVVTVTTH